MSEKAEVVKSKRKPEGKCPFCGNTMKEVSREVLREGTFITKECVGCKFRGTFRT